MLRPIVDIKKPKRKKIIVPEMELEEFPFACLFNRFYQKIKRLEADCDKVRGTAREYISTSQLHPDYRICFGKDALADN